MLPSVTPSAAPSVQLSDMYGVTVFAGSGVSSYGGNDGKATAAQMRSPRAIWFDATGNAYISDTNNHVVRKVGVDGVIVTVIGSGVGSATGTVGPATSAMFYTPYQLVGDTSAVYFVANGNYRVNKVDLTSGILSVFAGTGSVGSDGDGGLATAATFTSPRGICLDANKNVYISDTSAYKIRKVSATDGLISTITGTGAVGSTGDGSSATSVTLKGPEQLFMDSTARLYVADRTKVRVLIAGVLTLFAGTGATGSTDSTAPATSTVLNTANGVRSPSVMPSVVPSLTMTPSVTPSAFPTVQLSDMYGVALYAGSGVSSYGGNGGKATAAMLRGAAGIWFDAAGNGYISDTSNHYIRKVSTAGIISSVIGNGVAADTGNGGPATSASIYAPYQLHGNTINVHLTLNGVHNVKVVNLASGILSLVAGTGSAASDGDGGLASSASVNSPRGVFVDASSNVYITENGGNKVRKVSAADGLISTIIGVGIAGSTGDGGPGTSARVNSPNQLFVDSVGRLFFADRLSCKVRMFQAGIVTRFAGNEVQLSTDVTGPATSTSINQVEGVWATTDGVMFLSEYNAHKMKKVSSSGQMSTIAGTGVASSVATAANGDGGPAILATFNLPFYVGLASSGDVYVADSGNSKIRMFYSMAPSMAPSAIPTTTQPSLSIAPSIPPSTTPSCVPSMLPSPVPSTSPSPSPSYPPTAQPSLTVAPSAVPSTSPSVQLSDMFGVVTYAGTGSSGYSGNGVKVTSAVVKSPRAIWFDASGNAYISDTNNHFVRKVSTNGIITSVIGTGIGTDSGNGGPATSASIYSPYQLVGDTETLYLSVNDNNRVKALNLDSGILSVFAGTGNVASDGDGGFATAASLNSPRGIWLDANKNVYIGETSGYRVRIVSAADGLITTIIGTGVAGSGGDGGAATAARVGSLDQLYMDSVARLFVVDRGNCRVRVMQAGILSHFAGTGVLGSTDVTAAASSTTLNFVTGVWGTTDG
eukprot:gene32010-39543_t